MELGTLSDCWAFRGLFGAVSPTHRISGSRFLLGGAREASRAPGGESAKC